MIYVLIIVVLFAAISFILSKQGDDDEVDALTNQKAEIFASDMMQTAMQLQQAINQMVWTGTDLASLDFVQPTDAAFNLGTSHVDKVFHPEGGGIIMPLIPAEALDQENTDPIARWYIGRFNHVDWTPSTNNDVILVAHQIDRLVCADINRKLTGSDAIPEMTTAVRNVLIDASLSSAAGNFPFTAVHCAACENQLQLCVKDLGIDSWTYYNILIPD